jgi:hypothetical protein
MFVGVEIRQNTNAVRGATLQSVSQQSLDLAMAGLDNIELRASFKAANNGTLSEDQRDLMSWFYASKLRADENRFRQVLLGILDASAFQQLSNHRAYQFPAFIDYWTQNGDQYAEDFQQLVEREFLPLAQPPQSK